MENAWGYLGGSMKRDSLSLFPRIDDTITASDLYKFEQDRFRWLLEVLSDQEKDLQYLFPLWIGGSRHLLREHKESSCTSLEEFYSSSFGFGVHLLREEVQQLSYVRSLRNCLALRLAPGEPVVFLGPTSGSDLEAIHAAGGSPILVSVIPNPKWGELASLRLFEDRIPYEDWTFKDFMHRREEFRVVILSSWATEPDAYMRLASEAVGSYGFLLTPATNLLAVHEARKLSLHPVDTHQHEVGVFYKPVATGDLACS